VEDATRLFATDGRRLYRIVYPPEMADVAAYRAAVELDAVVLAAENEGTDWVVRMRFPDRAAFAAFRERCERRGLSVAARAVYTRARPETVDAVLTPEQHEALAAAAEMGYYLVPRSCSLAELAESLDLSSQAVSERLRRGTERLLSTTIVDN
jgi:predicted DNA binding protein